MLPGRVSSLRVWRAVEAQHVVSTLRLVDHDAAAHETLEAILEESKPPLPPSTHGLDYLLATPFRYPSPFGSRFRAPGDPGLFYGAVEVRTACAELGYWRWRFVADSRGLDLIAATPHTVFQAGLTGRSVDLRRAPWKERRAQWTHPGDYGPTQAFGREARSAGTEVIVYESVRDPLHAACAAVLSPAVFRPRRPTGQQTWFLTVTRLGASWRRQGEGFRFDFAT